MYSLANLFLSVHFVSFTMIDTHIKLQWEFGHADLWRRELPDGNFTWTVDVAYRCFMELTHSVLMWHCGVDFMEVTMVHVYRLNT